MRLLPRWSRSGKTAGRSRASEMGKPQQQRRRTVLLDRSNLRLARRREKLRSSNVPHLTTRLTRYLIGLDGQHQQSSHDERYLQPWTTSRTGKALWKRDAWTR